TSEGISGKILRMRSKKVVYTSYTPHLLERALADQKTTGDTQTHFSWLIPLLNEYYDPMYRYQLSKKQHRIIFRGNYQEVEHWLTHQ
ncbi:hypothetical protein ACU6X1_25175, partial [Klebsiella aerogenes]